MICHISKTQHGGGGVYTARLNDALVELGWESTVFCLDDSSLSPRRHARDRVTAVFDRLLSGTYNRTSTSAFHSFLRLREWEIIPEVEAADIVHLHSITGFIGSRGLKRLLRNRPRVFWTAHNPWLFTGGCVAYAGCDAFTNGCHYCPLLKPPLKFMTGYEFRLKRSFLEDYDVRVIANSNWMARMMRRSSMFEHLETIPVVPPIVHEAFKVQRERLQFRETLNLNDDRFVIGFSASSLTDAGKGIQDFFKTLPVGAKWLDHVTFLLIGDGKIEIPPGVDTRFMGRVSYPNRLAELYGACDYFVSSSFMETFGMAIMEAQACGTPVIAFEAGGTPEAVSPIETCRLVANRDFSLMYDTIEDVVSNGAVRFAQRESLAEWVRGRHSAAGIAARQIEIYQPRSEIDQKR
jgi:glycosyltransferase involved in cell wall biosynthesis